MAARKAQAATVPAPETPENAVVPVDGADQNAASADHAAELSEGSGRFPVLSPLRFDGRLYGPDDPEANEVVMPRDQAEALQPLGVLGEELV